MWISIASVRRPGHKAGDPAFPIPQLTGAGEVSPRCRAAVLSLSPRGVRHFQRRHCACAPEGNSDRLAGNFARDHGAKVPARLVSSAKSWLCHSQADRQARILPWGAGREMSQGSPVQATAAYLGHIRMAWNACRRKTRRYLENQR